MTEVFLKTFFFKKKIVLLPIDTKCFKFKRTSDKEVIIHIDTENGSNYCKINQINKEVKPEVSKPIIIINPEEKDEFKDEVKNYIVNNFLNQPKRYFGQIERIMSYGGWRKNDIIILFCNYINTKSFHN